MEEKRPIPVWYKGKEIKGVDLRFIPKGTRVSGTAYLGEYDVREAIYGFVETSVEEVVRVLDQLEADGEKYDFVELDILPNIGKGPWGYRIGSGASTWRNRMRGRPRRGR